MNKKYVKDLKVGNKILYLNDLKKRSEKKDALDCNDFKEVEVTKIGTKFIYYKQKLVEFSSYFVEDKFCKKTFSSYHKYFFVSVEHYEEYLKQKELIEKVYQQLNCLSLYYSEVKTLEELLKVLEQLEKENKQ